MRWTKTPPTDSRRGAEASASVPVSRAVTSFARTASGDSLRIMIRIALPLAALVTLPACSGYEEEEPVGAVTQREAEALDDAASMIEERRLPPDALPPEASEAGEAGGADAGEPDRADAAENGA